MLWSSAINISKETRCGLHPRRGPSGNRLRVFGAGIAIPPQHSPFGYTGRQFDPETGLYQYRARYYSPRLGQFLSMDPIGSKDDPNLYGYVGNDPVNATDPSGMTAGPICVNEGTCVWVDGNGNGDVTDDDVKPDQAQAFARDYGRFISRNAGRDISGYGRNVTRDGGLSRMESAARIASQFVGAAMTDAGGRAAADWASIRSIHLSPNDARLGGYGNLRTDNSIALLRNMVPFYGSHSEEGSPSDLARVILHETGHNGQDQGLVGWVQNQILGGEREVDTRARDQLKAFGLDGGGCLAISGFPAC